jgi:hypothetical protein
MSIACDVAGAVPLGASRDAAFSPLVDFRRAIGLGLGGYEAVQAAASLQVGADFLVTRNARDFKDAPVSPRSPGEILALMSVRP